MPILPLYGPGWCLPVAPLDCRSAVAAICPSPCLGYPADEGQSSQHPLWGCSRQLMGQNGFLAGTLTNLLAATAEKSMFYLRPEDRLESGGLSRPGEFFRIHYDWRFFFFHPPKALRPIPISSMVAGSGTGEETGSAVGVRYPVTFSRSTRAPFCWPVPRI